MDFIERLFHIAPDGGNGITELAIALICGLVPLAANWLWKRRRRPPCGAG